MSTMKSVSAPASQGNSNVPESPAGPQSSISPCNWQGFGNTAGTLTCSASAGDADWKRTRKRPGAVSDKTNEAESTA